MAGGKSEPPDKGGTEDKEARARRLREQIAGLTKGRPGDPAKPKNPRDFIHDKMRDPERKK